MASTSGDLWIRQYNEAVKLADDVTGMLSEKTANSASGPQSQRHLSTVRRKVTVLGTKLDVLESELPKHPIKPLITEKELNRRTDMLSSLRAKANQMAATLNMSNFANRDSLLGPDMKPVDVVAKTAGMDNQGIVVLQRQIMREQDDGLDLLEETVISTKHIALAVNEELELHTRLIDTLDHHVEMTGSRLQRVARSLAILNKKVKGGCSCMCLLLSIAGIVTLILAIFVLLKYL